MKLSLFIKDNIITIFITLVITFITLLLLMLFKVNDYLILLILILLISNYLFILLYNYFKRRSFYNNFTKTLDKLDKKYLITEIIKEGDFLESKILLEYLYEIDKSFHEEIKTFKNITTEFKEYIELWCHEIKTPIATSKLIIENNDNLITKSIQEEIEKIELFVEQVLYYSKSEILEKDYIIKDVNLKSIVENVIKKNKKELISKKIKIEIECNSNVKSDSKWLEYIINQIIINSIKYKKETNSLIKITSKEFKNNVVLTIKDNGIGIEQSELSKVFEKGFTGSNGRIQHNSTGMGLYLCKKLIDKLGHKIEINSELNNYTEVTIIIPKNSIISNLT